MTSDSAVAAVDCGTNSTRLLITDGKGATLRREMAVTRLGQGVDRTGYLADTAVARTVGVLRGYREMMDAAGVGRYRIVATSAARDASNSKEFFEAVASVMGTVPELLSGEEEGRLSFAGACSDLSDSQADLHQIAVVDIGGGSTEISVGTPASRSGPRSVSLDVGCVRITERFLEDDPPTVQQLGRARVLVAELVAAGIQTLRSQQSGSPVETAPSLVVGLAGTVSCLARLVLSMDVYSRDQIHHSWIDLAQVQRWYELLAVEDRSSRILHPGMEEGRVDVMVGGLAVLLETMSGLRADRILVSEEDILDGLAASLR